MDPDEADELGGLEEAKRINERDKKEKEDKDKPWWEKGIWKKWQDANDRAMKRQVENAIENLAKEIDDPETLELINQIKNSLTEIMSGDYSSLSDYSGVLYRGTGLSAYAFAGTSNEAGTAYLFENGVIVDSKKYQSISAGWILDGGVNTYGVAGLLPNANWDDFLGSGGAMSIGQTFLKTSKIDFGFSAGWTTPKEGINGVEFFLTGGKSLFNKDVNAGSVTYTQEYNSMAKSFYIPPEGWK